MKLYTLSFACNFVLLHFTTGVWKNTNTIEKKDKYSRLTIVHWFGSSYCCCCCWCSCCCWFLVDLFCCTILIRVPIHILMMIVNSFFYFILFCLIFIFLLLSCSVRKKTRICVFEDMLACRFDISFFLFNCSMQHINLFSFSLLNNN